jgi:hypothetical protein
LSLAKATQDGEPAAVRDAHAIVSPFARHPIVHHRGAKGSDGYLVLADERKALHKAAC